jgi:hypothetical protein
MTLARWGSRGLFAAILMLSSLILLAGCGGAHAPADAVRGEDALRTALESWKSGDTPETLHKRRPAIYLNDPDWSAGKKLLNYEIVEPLEPFGRQLRCAVKLTLESAKGGAKSEKRIGYQVETNPAFVIAREGM